MSQEIRSISQTLVISSRASDLSTGNTSHSIVWRAAGILHKLPDVDEISHRVPLGFDWPQGKHTNDVIFIGVYLLSN